MTEAVTDLAGRNNIGVSLDRKLRTSAAGTWWAGSNEGHRIGVLQLEPSLLGSGAAGAAARERLAAAVTALREANPAGTLRSTELFIDAKQAWLVVGAPPTPTLADLPSTLPEGARAGIALDVATALRELHAVGLTHGDLTADTIVVAASGRAALIEVAVLAAIAGRPTDILVDARAFAQLVRALGSTATPAEAAALDLAAAHAGNGDLAAAAAALAQGGAALPDFEEREALGALVPALRPDAARVPAPRTPLDGTVAGPRITLRLGRGVPGPILAPAAPAAATPRKGWFRRIFSR